MSERRFPFDVNVANAIRCAAYSAYMNSMGHPNTKAYEWWGRPLQRGDLCFERSTTYMTDKSRLAVGRFLRAELEPFPGHEGDENPPTELVFYIEDLDGEERRWTNCEFLPVPMTPAPWFNEAKKAP